MFSLKIVEKQYSENLNTRSIYKIEHPGISATRSQPGYPGSRADLRNTSQQRIQWDTRTSQDHKIFEGVLSLDVDLSTHYDRLTLATPRDLNPNRNVGGHAIGPRPHPRPEIIRATLAAPQDLSAALVTQATK